MSREITKKKLSSESKHFEFHNFTFFFQTFQHFNIEWLALAWCQYDEMKNLGRRNILVEKIHE